MEDVEDCYAYYVLLLEIPESVFWDLELSELLSIVADKAAYDEWLASENEKERDKLKKRR